MLALIERDLSAIIETGNPNPIPPDTGSGPYWVPIHDIVDDQSTGQEIIVEDPVVTIYWNKVERVRVKRDMTPTELDAFDDKALQIVEIDGIDKAQFKMIFQIFNMVKTLEGKPTKTFEEFKAYAKSLMR